MKRRSFRVYTIAPLLMAMGLLLQWVLLSGHIPFLHFVSIRANPDAGISVVLGNAPNYGPRDAHENPVVRMRRPDFQTGMIFPQWGSTAYGANDSNWQIGLHDIREQTGAQWIELPINFYQPSLASTEVIPSDQTPTPEAVAEGIRKARAMNYHVFVVPLLSVEGPFADSPLSWAGSIQYTSEQQTQAWFANYWQALEPYALASAQAGADELAIATECEKLQMASPALWNQLIEQVHALFPGKLTYDMNWSSLFLPVPSWMQNPLLTIGVSMYIGLTNIEQRLSPDIIPPLWQEKIRTKLDTLASHLGKPVLVSEIGYRDSQYALYQPWLRDTQAMLEPLDPAEQAAAYDAALSNVISDPSISGIFFWAWSVPLFEPNWKPASRVLHKWFTSYLA